MPPYWKRPYRFNFYKRRRRWRFPRRGARKTFRRRQYRRKRHRRYRKVKKRRFLKKKLKITVQQFQPTSIRKCKIIGNRCLFQCSPLRMSNNYIQYANSTIPDNVPGGGGWSLQVFSLENLFDDFEKLKNIWTNSNAGLPLVRFLGSSFKFYQTDETDYIVAYDRCWPMKDTPYKHADSSPTGMFLKKKKITVPSRATQRNKKPYKKVFIKPPAQMQSKWYFQQDLCKMPLLMLTTTAVSLRLPYCYPEAKNNNITLYCINTQLFQRPNFQNFPQTSGYSPKEGTFQDHHDPQHFQAYLYAYHSTTNEESITVNKDNIQEKRLQFLGNTKQFQAGTEITQGWENAEKNWGNPFFNDHIDPETTQIYFSNMSSTNAKQLASKASTDTYYLTKTDPLYFQYRYNPETDTGKNNKVWLVNNSTAQNWEPPTNTNLIFEGYPLYILLWGWPDWIKKAQITINPDENYIMVIQTDQFHGRKLPYYVLIDYNFIEGTNPYTEIHHDHIPPPTQYNQSHWYPKLEFQLQSIEDICQSGPGCARPPYKHYMQAFCKYKFYFKWGGCPKELQKAYNPCLQPKWTTPDNINGRLEISNPNTNPKHEIYDWDWDSDYITEDCIQRIKDDTEINPTIVSISANKATTISQKVPQEDQSHTKEKEKRLLQQLYQLQQQRLQLQQLLQ
nr:MAG: ORF1 [TTV-like mini virus]UGV34492.1 MAG: ORF1 [TTV-like mini virus]